MSHKKWSPQSFVIKVLRLEIRKIAGRQIKENKFSALNAQFLFQNPEDFFYFRCTVMDQRQAPSAPTEVHLRMASPSHRRYPSPFLKTVVIPSSHHGRPQWVHDICVYIIGHPWHREIILFPFSQTSSRFSSHAPRSAFASLQPELAWSSVGNHLTNQPPTGDVFDSSSFLIKWS